MERQPIWAHYEKEKHHYPQIIYTVNNTGDNNLMKFLIENVLIDISARNLYVVFVGGDITIISHDIGLLTALVNDSLDTLSYTELCVYTKTDQFKYEYKNVIWRYENFSNYTLSYNGRRKPDNKTEKMLEFSETLEALKLEERNELFEERLESFGFSENTRELFATIWRLKNKEGLEGIEFLKTLFGSKFE